MKTIILLYFIIFITPICLAQTPTLVQNKVLHFQIKQAKDTIDFVVIDTVLSSKKPVLLYCQGSLPMPFFVEKADKTLKMIVGGINNFDIADIQKHYHLVVIAMPKTPFLVQEKNLNDAYSYIPDSTKKDSLDIRFLKADYLDNYVQRADAVLRLLRKQKWVDNRKLVVMGHSQGTKVATKIARTNKNVTHLGLFAANPFGRIDQMVRTAHRNVTEHKMTEQEADAEIEQQYSILKYANMPEVVSENPGLLAWKTFSEPMFDDWLQLKQPIYLAYGTADITAELCDIIPLFFIQKNKTNLTHKRYWNVEHNFFEKNKDGSTNYEKGHWKEVMAAFIQWTNG